MANKTRVRVYGVVDDEGEEVSYLLDEMRQYGSACIIEKEPVDEGTELPDAENDFNKRWQRKGVK